MSQDGGKVLPESHRSSLKLLDFSFTRVAARNPRSSPITKLAWARKSASTAATSHKPGAVLHASAPLPLYKSHHKQESKSAPLLSKMLHLTSLSSLPPPLPPSSPSPTTPAKPLPQRLIAAIVARILADKVLSPSWKPEREHKPSEPNQRHQHPPEKPNQAGTTVLNDLPPGLQSQDQGAPLGGPSRHP